MCVVYLLLLFFVFALSSHQFTLCGSCRDTNSYMYVCMYVGNQIAQPTATMFSGIIMSAYTWKDNNNNNVYSDIKLNRLYVVVMFRFQLVHLACMFVNIYNFEVVCMPINLCVCVTTCGQN